jgi:hypothetical protein
MEFENVYEVPVGGAPPHTCGGICLRHDQPRKKEFFRAFTQNVNKKNT